MNHSLSRMLCAAALCCLFHVPGVAAQSVDGAMLSAGAGWQMREGGRELSLRLIDRERIGPLRPVYGLSVSTRGSGYAGAGLAYVLRGEQFFARASVMAGVYKRGRGRDLGGPVAFRSMLEVGASLANGAELGLAFDHRSNGGIYDLNPGLNTMSVFYTVPLR